MPRKSATKSPLPATVSADEGLIRLSTVLELVPVSASAWYRGMQAGIYPRPVKLSKRSAAWRVVDIRRLLTALAADA